MVLSEKNRQKWPAFMAAHDILKAMNETAPVPVEIGESVLYRVIGNEVVLLNMTSQEYFGLDSVGADIWKLITEYHDVNVVVRKLAALYATDEETIRTDIAEWLADLRTANLLKT